MSAGSAILSSSSIAAPVSVKLDMCVFARCHQWLVALDANPTERIIPPDEAQQQNTGTPLAKNGCLGLASVGNKKYAAWDLGVMLGLPPVDGAWVLLQLPFGKKKIPLALRTGTCVNAGRLDAGLTFRLPGGALRARKGAISGAFPAATVSGRVKDLFPVGLKLDFERLWTADELQSVAGLLAPSAGARKV